MQKYALVRFYKLKSYVLFEGEIVENIKVNTRFGELSVDPSQIVTFPRGLPGFEKSKRWKLVHEIDEQGNSLNGVVVHLQSIDDGEVSLSLTDPTLFGFNFDLVLSDSEAAEIGLEDPADVMVLTTLSRRDSVSGDIRKQPSMADTYANIAAPILINVKSRLGMQKVLVARESKVGFNAT